MQHMSPAGPSGRKSSGRKSGGRKRKSSLGGEEGGGESEGDNGEPKEGEFDEAGNKKVKKDRGSEGESEDEHSDDGHQPTAEEQAQLDIAVAAAAAIQAIHGGREVQYACPTCSRVFSRLVSAIMVHLSSYCLLADMRPCFQYNLKSHIRSHQNFRPFKCRHCGLSFTRNHDLNR